MIAIDVAVSKPYQVLIGKDILASTHGFTKGKKVAIMTDDTIKTLHLDHLISVLPHTELHVFSITPGESSKSSKNYIGILEWLAELKFSGSDILIAFGGGVIGDLAGFVAATYLRGIAYVQIPTTLLAMVDSSVGGKTAIDLPAGKNLVGAFYQPRVVVCDTDLLKTLPKTVLQDGYSEVIKYGMLGNAELLNKLLDDTLTIEEIIAICVQMKTDLVCEDEFDHGVRRLLNFGHTIGHAIEQLSAYEISHGQAVAIGMAMDTRSAVKQGVCDPAALEILLKLLEKCRLPSQVAFEPTALHEASLSDKKRSGGTITNVVPYELGKCRLETIDVKDLYTWIERGVCI